MVKYPKYPEYENVGNHMEDFFHRTHCFFMHERLLSTCEQNSKRMCKDNTYPNSCIISAKDRDRTVSLQLKQISYSRKLNKT